MAKSHTIPLLDYFCPGGGKNSDKERITNTYTGSFGTDPKVGLMHSRILCYKLEPELKENNPVGIKVTWYVQEPYSEKNRKSSDGEMSFDFSEIGRAEVLKYLLDVAAEKNIKILESKYIELKFEIKEIESNSLQNHNTK